MNNTIKVKFKKLKDNAVIPSFAHEGDAGLDLIATDVSVCDNVLVVKFGLAMEIPIGYVGKLHPRSSVVKSGLILSNSVGVIDSGYRGEIMAKYYIQPSVKCNLFNVGDKCAQLIIEKLPSIEIEEVEELSDTSRGTGGYGSTGG